MVPSRRPIEIVNALGLHFRAAQKFVSVASQFQADVRVHRDSKSANGRSILDLAMLAAECGTRLELEASGPDAERAISALSALIEGGFDENETVEGRDETSPRESGP